MKKSIRIGGKLKHKKRTLCSAKRGKKIVHALGYRKVSFRSSDVPCQGQTPLFSLFFSFMKRLLSIIIITSVLSLYGCYPANRISLIQPDRRIDDVNAMNTRVVLLQSFSFNVGLTIYTLPFGEYYPEGQDYMGIYYRAPIPIKINELSGEKKFIQSGIYLQGNSLKTSSPFAAWIYFNDNESIRTELIHYKFIWSYGDTWYREAYYGNSK